jgi:hypothetical protein
MEAEGRWLNLPVRTDDRARAELVLPLRIQLLS